MKEKISTYQMLSFLLCLSVASVTVTVIDRQFSNDAWLQWLQYGITLAVIACFFRLGKENRLYFWTAVLYVIGFCADLTATCLSSALAVQNWQWVFVVLGITSTVAIGMMKILECFGHSKTAPSMKKCWIGFLILYLAVTLVMYAGTLWIQTLFEAQKLSIDGVQTLNQAFSFLHLGLLLVYLFFLFRTLQIVKNK